MSTNVQDQSETFPTAASGRLRQRIRRAGAIALGLTALAGVMAVTAQVIAQEATSRDAYQGIGVLVLEVNSGKIEISAARTMQPR